MRKAMKVILAGAMAMSMCASAYAEEASVSTTLTEGGLTAVQDEGTSGVLGLVGAADGVCRADVTDGDEVRIPIDKPEGAGTVGLEVQILHGGEYIDSVTVKDDYLVVKVRNPGALPQPVDYTVQVALYDMSSGQPAKFYVTGTIGTSTTSQPDGSGSTSQPDGGGSTSQPDGGGSTSQPDGSGSTSQPDGSGSTSQPDGSGSTSQPDGGGSTSQPDGGGSTSQPDGSGSTSQPDGNGSTSQPEVITRIGLKGAENGVVRADLFKYGGNDKAEIVMEVPEGTGAIRLDEKDVVEGEDFIRKVSVKGTRLVIEGKFPDDLLEPEEYAVEVALSGIKSGERATFRIEGTVYWQDSYGPVAPDEFREKKYVIVDFDGNDGEAIEFRNGCLITDGLKNGIANLNVSYSDSASVDTDGLELYSVNFTANPRLNRNVTVCLEADEDNRVYEVKNGKLVQIDAKYNKANGELRFETRRLGEYIVTETALSETQVDKPGNTTSSNSQTNGASSGNGSIQPNGGGSASQGNSYGTNEYPDGVYHPGQFNKPNPGTGAYPLF